MGEDLNVTSAFVRVLMVEFVERQRPWITLETADDQTVAMVRTLPQYRDVQVPSVGTLAQRLAETHAETFTWDGGRLLLTDRAVSDRAAVFDVLHRFLAAVNAERPPAASDAPKQLRSDPAAKEGNDPASKEAKALYDFFDGYEKEIMKARLGQDTRPDHG